MAGLTMGVIALILSKEGEVVASVPPQRVEWIAPAPVSSRPTPVERVAVLQKGDNAFNALVKLGLPPKEAAKAVQAAAKRFDLRRVVAGRPFVRKASEAGDTIVYPVDKARLLALHRRDGVWRAEFMPRVVDHRRTVLAGVIADNLFEDAAKAGLDDATTMELVDIFAWDIDFARDLRPGDRFKVLLEERFDAEGALVDRVILAAEFINQGHAYRAVRFVLPDGRGEYFAPDGKSMRKAYLRAPLKYTRISSRFRLRRKHPILGYTRAHRGVDYAAPMGTPVRAVGDGTVVFAGRRGGYGRLIRIRHVNREHETYYAHLSRFARGIRRGKRVHQGQVIGYVGMSGLATGPHLHFEFHVRGRAVDPLHVHRAPAQPVPSRLRARFDEQARACFDALARVAPRSTWG